MEFVRISDKVISKNKIFDNISKILEYRADGFSQQEVALRMGFDRSLISRLEAMGEIRKGNRIAVIGFPILNKTEIVEMLQQEGVEFILLMSDKERWQFVRERDGLSVFNEMMSIITQIRSLDLAIIVGSNQRIKLMESLLDKKVIGIEIGKSPISEDIYVNPKIILDLLKVVKKNKR